MADREKVIKGLEICYCPPSKCDDCPYHNLPDEQSCNDTLCLDALALLKEQEPKKIVDAGVHDMNNHHKIYYGICPSCERRLYHKSSEYCPWCGQAVKWG